MTIGEAYTAVPPETPRLDAEITAELAKQGKMLFSKDGVHPTLQGSENYYMVSIATAWHSLAACAPADHAAKYNGGPFYSDVMEAAKIVPIKSSMLTGTWRRASENEPNAAVAKQFGTLPYFTETPGSKMSFAFRGSRCLIYDLFGPDCGQVFITVDGQRRAVPTARFDAYSGYYRTTALYVYGDMSGVEKLHTVEIELDSEQPSRAAIAESSTNPAKYNGTKWYPGRILIVGDLEPESSWFNARIEDYAIWPQDKNLAWGGVWDDAAEELTSVGEKGKLTIESGASEVSFQANQVKSLASGEVRSVTFESEIEFDEYKPEQLPAVDSEWKGGVLVVREESNELKYYGLVRDGSANAWKPLAGSAVRADGSPAVFRMTFKPAGASLVVNYNIDGIDCTYAGKTDISVLGSQTISDVVFGGSGTVHVLSAQADLPKNGLVLVVR